MMGTLGAFHLVGELTLLRHQSPAREDKIQVANFAGTWNVTIETPMGKIEPIFEIVEENGSISGSARTDADSANFYDVVADGDRLTWMQDVTTPMKLTLKFDVTVDGDTMTGTSKAGIFPASKLYGSRQTVS
jgi:hypothetical protein